MAGGTSPRARVVGAALRRYREMIGYQLEDAARVLDCDRSKISRIESGIRGFRMLELRILPSPGTRPRVAALASASRAYAACPIPAQAGYSQARSQIYLACTSGGPQTAYGCHAR